MSADAFAIIALPVCCLAAWWILRRLKALLILLLLGACATSVPVILIHPDGRTAQCGPYRIGGYGNQAIAAATSEVQCITDWKEQGFLRR